MDGGRSNPGRIAGILRRNRWFAGLPEELAREIVRSGRTRRVRSRPIFREGTEADGMFAVLSGAVSISHAAHDGHVGLLFVVRPGSWFGETSLFDGGQRNSEALAVGSVEVFHLPRSAFLRLTSASRAWYEAFVRLLCEHHRLVMDQLASVGILPVSARLAQRLLLFSRAQSGRRGDRVAICVSQAELATALGISRQALNRRLRALASDGVIALGYASIEVSDPGRLEKMVERAIAVTRS